jgi:hypothetical protein
MLQEIIRAKHQRRRAGQLIGAHALGKCRAMKAGLATRGSASPPATRCGRPPPGARWHRGMPPLHRHACA